MPLFDAAVSRAQPLLLTTVVYTSGPTYTKAGAQMLTTTDGESAGLLSGGCLEGDLAEHGREVLAGGAAKLVRYDMRGPDARVFGLGSGCEGTMEILLQRLDAAVQWQPIARLVDAWRRQDSETLLQVVRSTSTALPAGAGVFLSDGVAFGVTTGAAGAAAPDRDCAAALSALRQLAATTAATGASRLLQRALPDTDVLALHQPVPIRILVLGAGPDARPVVELAASMGWCVTVVDHRSHYAQASRFPAATTVLDGGPPALAAATAPATAYAAAIVMSHHFDHDRAYLAELARSSIPYLGLLGPAARGERLLAELGDCATPLRGRLRTPIGLDLGAEHPEAIALSIVAEIHAALAGRGVVRPVSAPQAPGVTGASPAGSASLESRPNEE